MDCATLSPPSACGKRCAPGLHMENPRWTSVVPALSIDYVPSAGGAPPENRRPTSFLHPLYPSSFTPPLSNLFSLPTSTMSTLPYDIIAMILAYFVPGIGAHKSRRELAAFASLAGVSHDWCTYVRPRLYGDISFIDGMSKPQRRLCCATLADSPQLASLVQTCTITGINEYEVDGLDIANSIEFQRALRNMCNLTALHLRRIDITHDILHSFALLENLDTLSLIGCVLDLADKDKTSASFAFALRTLVMHGTPSLGHDSLIAKLFASHRLQSLSIDSHSTKIGLQVLSQSAPSRLEKMYAEPSREQGALFANVLLQAPRLRDLGFTHGLRSLPLDPADLVSLRGSLSGLSRWAGPSAVMEYFLGPGPHDIEHIVLDQMVVLDAEDDAEFETLRPRNLVTSPEVEDLRIQAIQELLCRSGRLQRLDVVLSSSRSIKDIIGRCQPGLIELRVRCIEAPEHTVGLMEAAKALSKVASLREIHISSPPGYAEPEIERDLNLQYQVINHWSNTCSVDRIAFSAWMRWHRASQGSWTPFVTAPDVAQRKTARWRRKKYAVNDWEGHLAESLGLGSTCDTLSSTNRLVPSTQTPVVGSISLLAA
ncbi:hypothetical protein BS47DRAFT_1347977 [Hydnum rufescens UP504]|uniref:F-box domain-containing protein n=1 Tax=Hydnum rufescens UP504 TaxID=1448309 RepID=A0A9P6AS24_9AGAM|nr:hypothetical protein BS47DRAFT_1347977 [Hydnum rufescens UP504]